MNFFTPEEDLKRTGNLFDCKNDLPDVLIIGDSISIGYTENVRKIMNGTCNIHRPAANCGDTVSGLANIDKWLDDRNWAIIHFNWGLHDLCYRHPDAQVYGNRDKVKGKISVKPSVYKENLEKLVQIMDSRAKQLVWATTTYIPEGEAGRYQGDEVSYNSLAFGVMEKYGIPIDDLYELTQGFPPEMFTCPGDVHYTERGYELIAETVSDCIRKLLAEYV